MTSKDNHNNQRMDDISESELNNESNNDTSAVTSMIKDECINFPISLLMVHKNKHKSLTSFVRQSFVNSSIPTN